MQRRLLYVSLGAGFIAVTAQSLLIRELVIAFRGNELVIGVTLGAWLFWTGLGSMTLGRGAERSRHPARRLGVALAAIALLLPVCFIGAVQARGLLAAFDIVAEAEIAGPIHIIVSCLALLGPLCVFNGSIFPALCRVVAEEADARGSLARVYVWEAVGSAVGGALFAAFIVRLDDPGYAVAACGFLAAALASLAADLASLAAVFGVCIGVTVGIGALPGAAPRSGRTHVNSIYGRTSITRREETVSVFHNGVLSCTFPLTGASEPLVHLAMLQPASPRRVLLVGGLGGAAEEVLQYPDASVDIVELDPKSARLVLSQKPPSPRLDSALAAKRVRLIFEDARLYISRYRGSPYDVIILDLPSPVTAEMNRYYTVEFYRAVRRVLSDGGVFAFSVASAPSIGTVELREFIACIHRTAGRVFDDVLVAPGESNIFVAGKRCGRLTLNADELVARLNRRNISLKRFDATIRDDLNALRVRELADIIAESRSGRVNMDLRPIAYSQGLMVWTAKQRTPESGASRYLIDVPTRWLSRFAGWPGELQWGAVLLGLAFSAALFLIWSPSRGAAAGMAVATGGFTHIALEIIALLTFQALYGYVYAMLGLILAGFMMGLCVGGRAAARIIRDSRHEFRWLLAAQWLIAAYPVFLVAVIRWIGGSGLGGWWVGAAFLALTSAAGVAAGLHFPLAAAAAGTGRVAARFAALDLWGAALGALTVSTFLIPTLGFDTLAMLLSVLGVVGLLGLQFARRDATRATPIA